MKQLVRHYNYEKIIDEIIDENGNVTYPSHNSYLNAWHPKRTYQTKMRVSDLPEYYCDVQRYCCNYDVISAKDIKDMHYSWVKENHFMKDSTLRISYTGKLEPYHDKWMWEGKEITSIFTSYRNEDDMIFGNSIFKFLAYAHKYSKYDLSEIRKEFIDQCNWLKENEPAYAPNLKDFTNYGEWFDNTIKQQGEYED